MSVIDLALYRGDAPGRRKRNSGRGLPKRLREARLFLGYETAASFARARDAVFAQATLSLS